MKHQVVRLLCLVPLSFAVLYFLLSTKVSLPSSSQEGSTSQTPPTSASSSLTKKSKNQKVVEESSEDIEEADNPTEANLSPCKNGGVLFQGLCKCPIGWAGETCEHDLGSEGGPWAPEFHMKNTFYDEGLPPAFLKATGSEPVNNVLDVGCGLGLYLKGLWELGVSSCVGIEPSNMAKDPRSPFHSSICSLLQIDAFDPKKGEVHLGEKFDLVLSFEVAEHVPRERHTKYFDFITRHAEKAIIFSAAGIGQTGHGHISNRPACEWIEEFRKRGWYLDPEASWTLRITSKFVWFRDNLCIFRKSPVQDPSTLKKILALAIPHFYDSLPVSAYTFPQFPDWKEMQELDKSEMEAEWNRSVQTEIIRREKMEAELKKLQEEKEKEEKEKEEKEKAKTPISDDNKPKADAKEVDDGDDDDDKEEKKTRAPKKQSKSKKKKA
eukprot:TRINITY_DN1482_c0_g3_i2.p1 TRINITY_DN1482_c0_g3~~TRINITY_DN1482_c0_g3_i2.p1  ORF type:complete len:437 (-),score=125.32 TRINITY_DN1482_c0_g3_i2:252-1562(-)